MNCSAWAFARTALVVNGEVVIGFDKARINALLNL